MSHVVTHPVGSKIELISYCSSEVPSHSAYVGICYVPNWLLVQWASCLAHEALLGPREGLWWLPEASTHAHASSSHQCHLASYCERLSIVLKKGAQTSTTWSHTP